MDHPAETLLHLGLCGSMSCASSAQFIALCRKRNRATGAEWITAKVVDLQARTLICWGKHVLAVIPDVGARNVLVGETPKQRSLETP